MGRMRETVEAVLWDVGGVFVPSPFSHMRSFGPELGVDGDRLIELVFGPYHEDTDHPWHRLERGEATFDDTNTALAVAAAAEGVELDPVALLMRMGEGGTARLVRDEVVAAAQRVKADGYRTAIITNNIREFREGWGSLFDVDSVAEFVIDSSEVGLRKPDPAIFHLTLERLGGIAPERAVFLDDAPGNIVAAAALGIHAILVEDDPTSALAELIDLLGLAADG
jgi:putative hydrolase of the HAD superfamily